MLTGAITHLLIFSWIRMWSGGKLILHHIAGATYRDVNKIVTTAAYTCKSKQKSHVKVYLQTTYFG